MSKYGFRALAVIADAWGRTAQGQFMDMPKGNLPTIGDRVAKPVMISVDTHRCERVCPACVTQLEVALETIGGRDV